MTRHVACAVCGTEWEHQGTRGPAPKLCADCQSPDQTRDRSVPLVTYLGVRVAALSYAVRLALSELRRGKVAEAERVLRDVA